MRYFHISLGLLLTLCIGAHAQTAKVLKVLPYFLDQKGRESISPSLFDRDAYQVLLRDKPEERSAVRFDVNWKARGFEQLILRIDLKGGPTPRPKTLKLELPVRPGTFSRWTSLTLAGADYKKFGDVIAWRATLWDGTNQVAEQKSFLW